MTTQNATQTQTTPATELHPIAVEATTYFVRGNGNFSNDAIWALRASLDKLSNSPELGPAVASLLMVASHLENDCGAKRAAATLLEIAMSATLALEALNQKAQAAAQDRRQTLQGAKPEQKTAPRFGAQRPSNAVPLRNLKTPTKFV